MQGKARQTKRQETMGKSIAITIGNLRVDKPVTDALQSLQEQKSSQRNKEKQTWKRISTDGKHPRERAWRRCAAERSSCGRFGTCLGVLCEASAKAQRKTGVNGFEPDAVMRQLGWYRRTFGPFVGIEGSFILRV